jgi:hypothetical protein
MVKITGKRKLCGKFTDSPRLESQNEDTLWLKFERVKEEKKNLLEPKKKP